jgi:aspartate aminotransferase
MTVSTSSQVFADRIGRIEVSATMAVAAEAAKLRAQGVNLVDFGAGEPHFPTPRHIKDAAIAAVEANFTRYTVVPGIPELRKAIVERHATDFGSDYAVDEAIFTAGGKLALFNTLQILVDHGDEVILPVPYWGMRAGRWSTSSRARRRASALPRTRLRRRLRRRPRRLF